MHCDSYWISYAGSTHTAEVFNVLHPFILMVSAFVNEYLIPGAFKPVFKFVKKLERIIGLDIVVSTCLLNNPIAGSFG